MWSPGKRGYKFIYQLKATLQRWPPHPYMTKTFKIFFLRTWNLMFSTCNVQHQGLKPYKVKSMQRSGTEAIRTQLQPSKPKREITNITNSQNTNITYDQPSEQLFAKRWPLSNRNRTKNNINTRKVKRHRNSDTKNR